MVASFSPTQKVTKFLKRDLVNTCDTILYLALWPSKPQGFLVKRAGQRLEMVQVLLLQLWHQLCKGAALGVSGATHQNHQGDVCLAFERQVRNNKRPGKNKRYKYCQSEPISENRLKNWSLWRWCENRLLGVKGLIYVCYCLHFCSAVFILHEMHYSTVCHLFVLRCLKIRCQSDIETYHKVQGDKNWRAREREALCSSDSGDSVHHKLQMKLVSEKGFKCYDITVICPPTKLPENKCQTPLIGLIAVRMLKGDNSLLERVEYSHVQYQT